jgi:hypothetical protein
MSSEMNNPELAALEAALGALVPHAGGIDRDRLMFRAGQADRAGRRWIWPALTGVLLLAVMGLGSALVWQPAPQTVERIVFVRVEIPSESGSGAGPTSVALPAEPTATEASKVGHDPGGYLRLQRLVLRLGLDTLPDPPTPDAPQPALTVDGLLGLSPNGQQTPSKF